MATDYTAHANIVSWWYMEEESGTRYDGSANDNDLTDNNTVLYSSDSKQGTNSADFEEDNNESLSITDVAQTGLDVTGSFTIVFWMKAESFEAANNYIVTKYQTNPLSYQIYLQTDTLHMRVGSGGDPDTLTGGSALSLATWYHVAAVFDAGSNMHIYVNGSTSAPGATKVTAQADVDSGTGPFNIGCIYNQGYDGLLDEVAFFNTALGSADINSIMDNGLDGSGAAVTLEVSASECE